MQSLLFPLPPSPPIHVQMLKETHSKPTMGNPASLPQDGTSRQPWGAWRCLQEVVCFVMILRYHLVYNCVLAAFFFFFWYPATCTTWLLEVNETTLCEEAEDTETAAEECLPVCLELWLAGRASCISLSCSVAATRIWTKKSKQSRTSAGRFWHTRMCLNIVVAFGNACFIWQDLQITFFPLRITCSVEMLPYAPSCSHHFAGGETKRRALQPWLWHAGSMEWWRAHTARWPPSPPTPNTLDSPNSHSLLRPGR